MMSFSAASTLKSGSCGKRITNDPAPSDKPFAVDLLELVFVMSHERHAVALL